jgi:hypothetical protein
VVVEAQSPEARGITLRVQRDGRRFTVDVVADGEGVVSHAGAALLAETADRLRLTDELSRALAGLRQRRGRHDPGRVVHDLAVMLADGGDCLADLRAVRDQQPLFGPVASDATAFRVIDALAGNDDLLAALRVARARARANAWKLGAAPARVVIDIDATLICAHSEKEGAAGTFRRGFGFHPLLAFPGSVPRGAGRHAAARQRRRQHRRRPHRAGCPGLGAVAGSGGLRLRDRRAHRLGGGDARAPTIWPTPTCASSWAMT